MYVEDHPDQNIGPQLGDLLDLINDFETQGKLTIEDTRELMHRISGATEEMIVRSIGASAARLYGIEDGE